MRSIEQSPVVRVKTSRSYSSARQRWQERIMHESHHPVLRRSDVEAVPEQRRESFERQDCDEREPMMNVSAPLRYSQTDEETRCSGRRSDVTHAATSQSEDNVRPSTCRSLQDDVESGERLNLLGLMKNTPGAFADAAQSTGDVSSVDQKMETLSVAQQEARLHAQRMIQQKSLATRRRVLMNILGLRKFYKVLALVKEVKAIREKLLRSCASESSIVQPIAPGKIRVCKLKFEALHKTARDLLQSTDLVASVERTEVERLVKLPWDELISQAQQNLYSYREYISISEIRE